MNIVESVKVALSAILGNKMRSLLTMLGIIIGISSVITVVAIGEGSQKMIDKEFEQFGAGKAYMYTNWSEEVMDSDMFTKGDLEAVQSQFGDELKAVMPGVGGNGNINLRKKKLDVNLLVANEKYKDIAKLELLDGRFLIKDDITSGRNVGVINKKAAMDIFGRSNVVGETLDINLENKMLSLTLVGVYEDPKSNLSALGGGGDRASVYIPYTTMMNFSSIETFSGMEIVFEDGVDIQGTKDKIITLVERRHESVGENKYVLATAEEELGSINKITGIITMVIGAIAAISLLVGGIGVMNIMFVSVTERTREIGIRKAIGAKRKDILLQFLVESVIVSGIGGIIGTILGIGFSSLISVFIKIPPSVSLSTIAVAWLFSAGVGIFFGIYPANKASKLDPIEALRYE